MYRKIPVIGIIILFFISGYVTANNLNQCIILTDGITFYVGGSGSGNYTKIQDAINDASDGDKIFVYNDSSPYFEHLFISRQIQLIGEDRNSTIIDGNGTEQVIQINNDNINISGFTIQHSGELLESGIVVNGNNIRLYDNNIINNGNGISIRGDFNTISKNLIANNEANGIYLSPESTNNIIEYNIFNLNNQWEITPYLGDIGFDWDTDYNSIIGNTIENSKHTAISILGHHDGLKPSNTIISHNLIKNVTGGVGTTCGSGIYLRWCHNNDIFHNTIINCIGIELSGSSFNRIYQNNFISSKPKCTFLAFSMFNTWDGNYWGEPRLLPYPIFGHIWLITPWINFDWHPAQVQN